MRFIVIGHGFVGKAMGHALGKKHHVELVDPYSGPSHYESLDELPRHGEISGFVICVPTPEREDGSCNDDLVLEYVREIMDKYPETHILIKSTTSVTTLAALEGLPEITFSPEFLRGSVGADPTNEFMNSEFAIYGGLGGRWWHEVLSQVVPYKEVRFLDLESAGFLKYVENSFLALKVMFFNEVHKLYDRSVDINYNAMIEALALDKRVGMSHTQVPGPDGKFGFGGHCLPKDTSEFVEFAKKHNCKLKLLETARKLNDEYR